jgi:excisionase family DNA binding protein
MPHAALHRESYLVSADVHDREPLATAAQVGAHFVMSERAVYHAVARGTLPALRLGRRLRFRISDVERALRSSPLDSPTP